MKSENRDLRQQQIEEAAYSLLQEKGYRGTSMLAIAKRARASNETLYAWYGNKQELFRRLIEKNAEAVHLALENALTAGGEVESALDRIGEKLLELVTGERAISLNRAAAADINDTGTLGKTLASAGRDSVAPLLAELFSRAERQGSLAFADAGEITEVYLGLLIGDLQIRRVIGAIDAPERRYIKARARRARQQIVRLYTAR